MLDPYENITVGNFLYSLGLVVGAKAKRREVGGCINLTQQTPLDGLLADVYLAYPGLIRIIEFKRESNDSVKEPAKRFLLRAGLKRQPQLVSVSRIVHWSITTSEAAVNFETKVVPYIDAEQTDVSGTALREFIESIAIRALENEQPEFPGQVIAQYLELVATWAGSKGTSSSGLVVMLTKQGTLRYLQVESIRDLRLPLQLLAQRLHDRRREFDRIRERNDPVLTPHAQGKNHGLGRDVDQGLERKLDDDRGNDYSL